MLLELRKDALRGDRAESHVVIQGEEGTGKEAIARMIHAGSRRAKSSWIVVNCAHSSSPVFATEFFGTHDGPGLFEQAHEGTLFLSQVDDLSQTHQTLLLDALKTRKFDVRVIASTQSDLREKVAQGKFASELYQQICQVMLDVPSLRAHSEDVVSIALQIAQRSFHSRGKKFSGFTPDAEVALTGYSWPGNVRELIHVMERLALTSKDSNRVSAKGLLLSNETSASAKSANLQLVSSPVDELATDGSNYTDLKRKWSDSFERQFLIMILDKNGGNVSAAARAAKLDRSNFLRLLRRHGLKAVEYRKAA
jgi:two-component system response regulator HydG